MALGYKIISSQRRKKHKHKKSSIGFVLIYHHVQEPLNNMPLQTHISNSGVTYTNYVQVPFTLVSQQMHLFCSVQQESNQGNSVFRKWLTLRTIHLQSKPSQNMFLLQPVAQRCTEEWHPAGQLVFRARRPTRRRRVAATGPIIMLVLSIKTNIDSFSYLYSVLTRSQLHSIYINGLFSLTCLNMDCVTTCIHNF